MPKVRLTVESNNRDEHIITCDTGILATKGKTPLLMITFTVESQCGTIQGTAKHIVKHDNFSHIANTRPDDDNALLVKWSLPPFLQGSNISCQVRLQGHQKVHHSAKKRLSESQNQQVSAQGKQHCKESGISKFLVRCEKFL